MKDGASDVGPLTQVCEGPEGDLCLEVETVDGGMGRIDRTGGDGPLTEGWRVEGTSSERDWGDSDSLPEGSTED